MTKRDQWNLKYLMKNKATRRTEELTDAHTQTANITQRYKSTFTNNYLYRICALTAITVEERPRKHGPAPILINSITPKVNARTATSLSTIR